MIADGIAQQGHREIVQGRRHHATHLPRCTGPAFGIDKTVVDWKEVAVIEKVVWSKPFCRLIHFVRDLPTRRRADPRLLIVAPMSGHYATLLRGTVEALLPHADVYITDWADARMVPLSDGAIAAAETPALRSLRAKVAELADALDSGSSGVTPVRVQVPSFALTVPARPVHLRRRK